MQRDQALSVWLEEVFLSEIAQPFAGTTSNVAALTISGLGESTSES